MIMVASALALLLSAIAAAHFYWSVGGVWPAADKTGLVDTVLGARRATTMPPGAVVLAVACAIEAAALIAALLTIRIGGAVDAIVTLGGAVLCVIFLVRFSFGYLAFWRRRFDRQPFARLDALVYSPLCLAIAIGFALLLSKRF